MTPSPGWAMKAQQEKRRAEIVAGYVREGLLTDEEMRRDAPHLLEQKNKKKRDKYRAKMLSAIPNFDRMMYLRRRSDPKNVERDRERNRRNHARPEVRQRIKERHKEKMKTDPAYRAKRQAAVNARRRKTKIATPAWADLERIRTRYKERATMERLTGVRHDVDHRIPLCGENVCGLHVAENLRVILARDNRRKSNHHGGQDET